MVRLGCSKGKDAKRIAALVRLASVVPARVETKEIMPSLKMIQIPDRIQGALRRRLPKSLRRPAAIAAALMCALLVTALLSVIQQTEAKVQPPAPSATATSPKPFAVEPSYPITGYFISASSRDMTNFKKLEDVKASGGDTVITFGTALQPVTLESIPPECAVNGKNCAQVAAGPLSVDRYFTFLDGSNWGKSALKCPNDRQVTNGGQSYSVLVLPKVGQGCTSSNGRYDVVVVGGSSSSAVDPSKSLSSAATKLGMNFYAGLPAPAKRLDLPYLPDDTYQGTFSLFTDRFLAYQASVNNVPGLAGFYHHTEMPLTDSEAFDSVLALYRTQNSAIHRYLPTRQAVVSPYIEARVGGGTTLEKARNGIRKIAGTSSGLVLNIAIQDGMGTGKGGAFTGSEADSSVDPFAATIVGKGTWGNKYLAPNRDYFAAAAVGVSGTGAVLWANLEGMAPATDKNACADSLRGQTTKTRLDRQLQQLGHAKKVISFMWDPYFTCKGSGTPLKNQIQSGLTTPIITEVTFSPDTGRVEVVGFNLAGSTVTMRLTSNKGQRVEKSVKVSNFNSAYGVQNDMNPKLQKLAANVISATKLNLSNTYSVWVTNGWGERSTEYRSKLP